MYNHTPIYVWLIVLSFLVMALTIWVVGDWAARQVPTARRLPKGFKPNPGYMPVPECTEVDVVYNSGEINYGVLAYDGWAEGSVGTGSIPHMGAHNWRADPDLPDTIVGYRLRTARF